MPSGRNKGGFGQISLPSAFAASGLRWFRYCQFFQQAVLVIFSDGKWKMGNIEEKRRKFAINARNQGGIGEILLPSASASFRSQLFAVVSLLLDFYPGGGVGIFLDGR